MLTYYSFIFIANHTIHCKIILSYVTHYFVLFWQHHNGYGIAEYVINTPNIYQRPRKMKLYCVKPIHNKSVTSRKMVWTRIRIDTWDVRAYLLRRINIIYNFFISLFMFFIIFWKRKRRRLWLTSEIDVLHSYHL